MPQVRTFERPPVFRLAPAVTGTPRMLPDQNEHQDYEVIRGWVDVRLEVARLLDTGLHHDRVPPLSATAIAAATGPRSPARSWNGSPSRCRCSPGRRGSGIKIVVTSR